jgi:hypothetical protein
VVLNSTSNFFIVVRSSIFEQESTLRVSVYDFHNQIKIVFPSPQTLPPYPIAAFIKKLLLKEWTQHLKSYFSALKRVQRLFYPQKVTFDDLCPKTNETRIVCNHLHFRISFKNAPEIMIRETTKKFSSSKH